MSNPTIVAENFSGSLGAFTGVDPIRYDSGAWFEEAVTNYFPNPEVAAAGTAWTYFASTPSDVTYGRVTDQPDMGVAAWEYEVLNIGPGRSYTTYGKSLTEVAGLTGSITPSVLVKANRAITSVNLITRLYYSDVSQDNVTVSRAAPTIAERITWPTATINGAKTLTRVDFIIQPLWGNLMVGDKIWMSKGQIENNDRATSYLHGSAGSGFAWTGTTDASTSTRAASSASVTTAEPASVACWYREAYSGPKTFAYIEPYGALGTYGSIAYAAGDLTLSTTRNLVIGPFAAFDRVLTANEQANLRSTQNWSMNSVNGSNIILPLSGRRRPR